MTVPITAQQQAQKAQAELSEAETPTPSGIVEYFHGGAEGRFELVHAQSGKVIDTRPGSAGAYASPGQLLAVPPEAEKKYLELEQQRMEEAVGEYAVSEPTSELKKIISTQPMPVSTQEPRPTIEQALETSKALLSFPIQQKYEEASYPLGAEPPRFIIRSPSGAEYTAQFYGEAALIQKMAERQIAQKIAEETKQPKEEIQEKFGLGLTQKFEESPAGRAWSYEPTDPFEQQLAKGLAKTYVGSLAFMGDVVWQLGRETKRSAEKIIRGETKITPEAIKQKTEKITSTTLLGAMVLGSSVIETAKKAPTEPYALGQLGAFAIPLPLVLPKPITKTVVIGRGVRLGIEAREIIKEVKPGEEFISPPTFTYRARRELPKVIQERIAQRLYERGITRGQVISLIEVPSRKLIFTKEGKITRVRSGEGKPLVAPVGSLQKMKIITKETVTPTELSLLRMLSAIKQYEKQPTLTHEEIAILQRPKTKISEITKMQQKERGITKAIQDSRQIQKTIQLTRLATKTAQVQKQEIPTKLIETTKIMERQIIHQLQPQKLLQTTKLKEKQLPSPLISYTELSKQSRVFPKLKGKFPKIRVKTFIEPLADIRSKTLTEFALGRPARHQKITPISIKSYKEAMLRGMPVHVSSPTYEMAKGLLRGRRRR